MKLLIDDIRNIEGVDIICRNSAAAKAALQVIPITELYLDNDLGEAVEGYQILQWALQLDLVPDTVHLVTANIVARQKMIDILLMDMKYVQNRMFKSTFTRPIL